MEWLPNSLVYLTKAGSQAYGLSNELSDLDIRGVCIPPRHVENDLFHRFEQAENPPYVEGKFGHLKNPKNPKFDSSVYSLRKFFILAANVNPNIIELLWTDSSDHLLLHPIFGKLMENRKMFLSTKAKWSFSGYAMSQSAKIKRHRKWIVLGEVRPPNREDFGLPAVTPRGVDEVFGYIKSKVEEWNLNQFPVDEQDRAELKETIWELVYTLSNKTVSWDNWPDAYTQGVIKKFMEIDLNLKEEVIVLINAERAYAKAKSTYESWIRWKKERNPARRELEVKSGYDTKHASHLVRLMRMGYEIMTEGEVIVKRPDREELLSIKNGAWSYEKVMEYADQMQIKLDEVYKSSFLPKSVDHAALNKLYHRLSEEFHNT